VGIHGGSDSGIDEGRILRFAGACPARQNAACDVSPRGMMSRWGIDGSVFDRHQGRVRMQDPERVAAAKCRTNSAFATPNIALHISNY